MSLKFFNIFVLLAVAVIGTYGFPAEEQLRRIHSTSAGPVAPVAGPSPGPVAQDLKTDSTYGYGYAYPYSYYSYYPRYYAYSYGYPYYSYYGSTWGWPYYR